ncbi:hypothetical protein TKK_0013695 [Trichogramma kaykai]|uniref:RNase H type-1 domain-containing protein n=1 Tax=Trichogramma kaykai TaxID=54128 RepID=A0ABD2WHC2_9HYME
MTIPRLELRTALRLLRTICNELGISIHLCCVWSDSRIALHWIESTESTGNSVVDSYVQQIQEHVPCGIWQHVPSSDNPADVASRGVALDKLAAQQWWLGGPPWLAKSSSAWPASRDERDQPLVQPMSDQCLQLKATDCFGRSLPSLFSDLNRLLRFMV